MDLERILSRLAEDERSYITRLIEKDPLTGAYNRRKFDRDLELVVSLTERTRKGTSFFMIDIDHFKRFNDAEGHQRGDEVLQTVTRCIEQSLRQYDRTHLYRYGGEEFVVLMPDVDCKAAKTIGERIRENVAACAGVTVSIGIAHFRGRSEDLEEVTRQADEAMYRAKERGRDRVELFEERPDCEGAGALTVKGSQTEKKQTDFPSPESFDSPGEGR
jgi:diguanylate cyclase (GGDEF)-like protein